MSEKSVEPTSVERSFALTVAALLLLSPPILTIFDIRVLLFGIPVLHVYCFAIWLVAILCGRALAKRLDADDLPPATGGPPPAGGA